MADTPERIWIEQDDCPYFYEESELAEVGSPVTEYIRADLCHLPAPAATDTGLVTYAHDNGTLSGLSRNEHGPWCLRSQAEELLAAKDATIERHREAQVILSKQLNEVIADNAALTAEKQRMLNTMSDMSNTNKKLTARIKELEKLCNDTEAEALGYARLRTR